MYLTLWLRSQPGKFSFQQPHSYVKRKAANAVSCEYFNEAKKRPITTLATHRGWPGSAQSAVVAHQPMCPAKQASHDFIEFRLNG